MGLHKSLICSDSDSALMRLEAQKSETSLIQILFMM